MRSSASPPPRLPRLPRLLRLGAALLAACAVSAGNHALADDPSPRRPVPDYDGRRPDEGGASEVFEAMLRGVLSPAYVVSEYLLRRPIGWLVRTAEQEGWPGKLAGVFTGGDPALPGVIPTALIEFGFRPSVGLYVYWNDVGAKGHQIRVHGATWGGDWLRLSVADRLSFGDGLGQVGVRGVAVRRGDRIFAGLGPTTLESDVVRYREEALDGGLFARLRPYRSSELFAQAGVRRERFGGSDCCDQPSIEDAVASGRLPRPAGFEGYDARYLALNAALDTRSFEGQNGSGVRLEGGGELGSRFGSGGGWARYGGAVGGFIDVDGHERLVGLQLAARFADPIAGAGEVPFNELAKLGGDEPMRGFRYGRLAGRSALAATLEYRWPIYLRLDGSMHYAVGNVFGPHLEGLEAKLLRQSVGIGIRARYEPDYSFHFLFALGSETFSQGAAFTSTRFVIGVTHGF